MTGLKANRPIYLEIQDRPQDFLLTAAQPRSIEIFVKVNLKVQIDSLLPEGPVIIMFYYTIMLRGHSKQKMIILVGTLLDFRFYHGFDHKKLMFILP